jgi:hypothetical protein
VPPNLGNTARGSPFFKRALSSITPSQLKLQLKGNRLLHVPKEFSIMLTENIAQLLIRFNYFQKKKYKEKIKNHYLTPIIIYQQKVRKTH